jgi:hypothetical protein
MAKKAKRVYKLRSEGEKQMPEQNKDQGSGQEITAIVPAKATQAGFAVVQPAVSTDQALAHFQRFLEIKEKVLNDNDKEPIKGKPYIRKTGWRKIKTMFNLTEEILESKRERFEDGEVIYTYKVRVTAPNGAFADAEMNCSTKEPFGRGKPESAVMAMAQTRAFNRAISDLVGGGEVSAEEMAGIDTDDDRKNGNGNGNGHSDQPANGGSNQNFQPKNPDAPASEKQIKFLHFLIDKKGLSTEQVKARSIAMFGKESSKTLTMGEISQLIDYYYKFSDKPTEKDRIQKEANEKIQAPDDIIIAGDDDLPEFLR